MDPEHWDWIRETSYSYGFDEKLTVPFENSLQCIMELEKLLDEKLNGMIKSIPSIQPSFPNQFHQNVIRSLSIMHHEMDRFISTYEDI